MKMWNYGDSHAAGHELGTKYADCLGNTWISETFGYKDRHAAIAGMGRDRYQNEVREVWYEDVIDNIQSHELSYAGLLGNLLSIECVHRAIAGSSNDLNILKMYQDKDKWEDDDIILFSVVTPLRYIPARGIEASNFQAHNQSTDIVEVLWEYGPHDITFRLAAHGYMALAKSLHKNVITLYTVDDDTSVEGYMPKADIEKSFTGYSIETVEDIEEWRYPGGHLHESLHVQYANYLMSQIK